MARADSLFVELTGSAREVLGLAIANFRAALEHQDTGLIAEARRSLLDVVDRFHG